MVNLKYSFLAEAARRNDTLRSVVVGHDAREGYSFEAQKLYLVESWEAGSEKLNYSYNSGYGGADCHSVVAWGDRFVYSVHEYEGATGVISIPRNPEECIPGWGYTE